MHARESWTSVVISVEAPSMSPKSIALAVASLLLARGASAASAQPTPAELPSGRLLAPVGVLVSTPNFPTQVVVAEGHVAVLNGGANKRQSLRLYAADDLHTLAVISTLLGKSHATAAPGANVAQGRSGELSAPVSAVIPNQSLFQGLSTGANGMLYATGGASDDLLAFAMHGGTLTLQRRYALHWQAFPRTQYPYQYAGNQQQTRHFYPDSVVIGPGGTHAYVTGLLANSLARVNLVNGAV
ncbi:phosphoesterase, partial [mine drainage metagenome]